MNAQFRKPVGTLVSSLAAAMLLWAASAWAHDEHASSLPMHGGVLGKSKAYQFEAVFTKDGVKVYPYRVAAGKIEHVATDKLTGSATLKIAGVERPYRYELRPAAAAPAAGTDRHSHAPAPLAARVDLSKLTSSSTQAVIQISGLPSASEPSATFAVPFVRSDLIAMEKTTAADAKAIAAQKTCAVTGEELGSMGPPLKVVRGGQSVLICCKGCVKKIQAEPDKYFKTASAAGAAKKPASHAGHNH